MVRITSDKATEGGNIYDTRKEANKDKASRVRRWLAEIDLAQKVEQDWRKQADDARDMFRSEGVYADQRYNLQYANVQTLVPTLYSQRPAPDVRRRYADKGRAGEAERIAAQIIERNLVACMDYYDFDGMATAVVQSAIITGRGVPRVRHEQQDADNFIFNSIKSEVVPWRDLVIGPCETWEGCPWIAFHHLLTREQLIDLAPGVGAKVSLETAVDQANSEDIMREPNVFKRASVYEIWDKIDRRVIWIAESWTDGPLREDDDPLVLIDFFPIPKPYYYSETHDTMVPMVPAAIIKPMLEELNELSRRIHALTRVIRWRGLANSALKSGLSKLSSAKDGQIEPAGEDIAQLVTAQGGLAGHIWLMPIREAAEVLATLQEQREALKQVIFEVSGVSDILRGQSDPDETLGAQQIKANFGTLRIQHQQRMVQRCLRDLLRIKAELMCSEYEMSELLQKAGMKLPTQVEKQFAEQKIAQLQQQAQMQAPQQPGMPAEGGSPPPQIPPELQKIMKQPTVEEVEAIIRDDLIRTYVIDVETDSTIQQDMKSVQANMGEFLNGTAAFLESIMPAVQAQFLPAEAAVDLYLPFARSFKLGKQAEDALEGLADSAKDAPPQQQKPDPEQQKMEMEAASRQQDIQHKQQTMQLDAAERQQEMQHEKQMNEIELVNEIRKSQVDQANAAINGGQVG